MISGSLTGAARLLNVSQPGVSRTMKHLELVLGVTLFVRQGGRFIPAPEAHEVFVQLHDISKKLENLQFSMHQLERGRDVELAIGSVPSIANCMVPRAISGLRQRFPDIVLNIELLKIEEAIDYLLLGRGELVCMSHLFEHPSITFKPLATGRLVCLVDRTHPLASREQVSAYDIAQYALIGIDPSDPYGAILAQVFDGTKVDYKISIRARFGTTVISLVKQNLGVAVLDSFTVADLRPENDGVVIVPIENDPVFYTYVAMRNDRKPSSFAERFVEILRETMNSDAAI